jgi:CRISPR-associated protein Cmr3
MNTILLQPTDVLFFRDGRPMTGALAGHGAAWPMPNVVNAAFHAALHRSGFGKMTHSHRRGSRGRYEEEAQRDRKFGSLITVGPFPVKDEKTWFFPRPLDLQDATLQPALLPVDESDSGLSSLPIPLKHAVANRLPPKKISAAKGWLSQASYQQYLNASDRDGQPDDSLNDAEFFDTEHSIGIEIDSETGTAGQGDTVGKLYSAHYLRLRDNWQLGVCASADDKGVERSQGMRDLIKDLFTGEHRQITVGGQQRSCSALCLEKSTIPLPIGKVNQFREFNGKVFVKWVLLTPSIWPEIKPDGTRNINAHPGGWLPNWIHAQTGEVLLKAGETSRQGRENRDVWRQRVRRQGNILAKLVSAVVPKSMGVSGWALPDELTGEKGGAKSTHLAVPAGAVYYFEADSASEAEKLSAVLNWHGQANAAEIKSIKNRRSTLLGEKGFGLGVCGTWNYFGASNA